MKLTEQERKDYLEGRGGRCPFCGSDSIDGGSLDVDGPEAYQEVSCNDCPGRWRDIYTLTNVVSLED